MLPIENRAPRYYQIFQDIYNKIDEGDFKNGDQLPSEAELCKAYNVSRGTLREGLKLLFQYGLLVREQGRGTFVTVHKIGQDVNQLMGFTSLMQSHNKKASGKILETHTKLPNPIVKQLMQLDDNEEVVRIIRLRYGDDKPLIIERSYFTERLFKPLQEYDLEKESIYELLYKHTNQRLGKAKQSIEAAVATPTEAELFNINVGAPLLLMTRLIMLRDGTPFEYSKDIYRADKLKFTIETKPYEESSNNILLELVNFQ
ncbi:MAG: GntR family transcriptional regulator [Ignavibacteriae bacterium]|nr:GntR family transcriptional regulator [Ignavibacteriota bacterium]NOG97628.1 GntR family transcriptional regulator [Ignavibacteriota bacterium]